MHVAITWFTPIRHQSVCDCGFLSLYLGKGWSLCSFVSATSAWLKAKNCCARVLGIKGHLTQIRKLNKQKPNHKNIKNIKMVSITTIAIVAKLKPSNCNIPFVICTINRSVFTATNIKDCVSTVFLSHSNWTDMRCSSDNENAMPHSFYWTSHKAMQKASCFHHYCCSNRVPPSRQHPLG